MVNRSDPRIARKLGQFAAFCSVLATGFGLLVLTGWAFRIESLKTILRGQVAVKANAAFCFILIGLALWLLRNEGGHRPWQWKFAARVAALLASAIGLASFLEFWRGWDLGIDQLLFPAGPEDLPGSVRPGLMSPLAAFGFCFLGAAIALLDARSPWLRRLLQALSGSVAVVSIFGILDFVLEPATTHTHIAPTTALVLFLLSFAVKFSRTQWGIGSLLASTSSGGEVARRLLPAAILIPIIIGWFRWRGEFAGLYSAWMGVCLMTVAAVALLSGFTLWTAFVTDRADRLRQQAEESVRRLASVVNYSTDAITGKTLDGIVTSWNPAAESIYGFSAAEILGQSMTITVPADRRDEFHSIMQRAARGEIVHHYETVRLRKGGQRIDVSLSVSPVKDESGKVVAVSTAARDITERKQAEEKLKEASLYTRNLIEASLDPLVTISREGKITDVNEGTEKVTGLSRQQLIGSDFSNYFTQPEEARRGYQEVFAKGFVRDYPLAIRHRSGKVTEVLYNATLFKNARGEVDGVFAAARDITERKLAEQRLRNASLYARSLIEASLDPLVTISREGKVTDVNQATEKVTGLSRQQLIGSDFSNYFTKPEDARRGYQEVFAKGFVHDYPLAIRHTSGRVTDVLYNASLYRNEKGEIGGVFAAARDITERKRVEQELRLSRERLVLAQKAGHSGAFEWDIVNNINAWSPEIEELYGLAPGEFGGKYEDWEALVVPEDLAAARACIETSLKTGEFGGEWRIRRRNDGQIRWLTARAKVILDENGKPLRMIGVNMDVTERKLAEEQVRKAAHYARTLIEASLDPLVTIRKDGKISDVNQATEKVTGVSREHLIGSDFSDYFTEPDKARLGYQQVFSQGSVRDYPLAIRNTSGAITDVLYNATLFTNQAGEVEGIFAAARDVTQIKAAEQEVRCLNEELEQRVIQRTAQLEAANKELEAFNYSVSHDLRAPLRHISGFSKILTEEFGSQLPAEAQHHLQRIDEGTRRMGLLVDDLLNLGRVGRRELSLQVAGLRSIVEEVIYGLEPDVGDRQVEWKIGNLPYVECDTALMKQAFQNLLSNALKFTRPRAHAILEVGQQEKDGASVVYIRDNGVGFSMKYADKLFGVFQRLHRPEDFEGTGVGLATVQRIIQKHGGRIWAEAELDKGATFYFTLGSSEKHETKAEAATAGDMHA